MGWAYISRNDVVPATPYAPSARAKYLPRDRHIPNSHVHIEVKETVSSVRIQGNLQSVQITPAYSYRNSRFTLTKFETAFDRGPQWPLFSDLYGRETEMLGGFEVIGIDVPITDGYTAHNLDVELTKHPSRLGDPRKSRTHRRYPEGSNPA